jgi:hypothetical protein
MRYAMLLLIALPLISFSQTKTDYDNYMARFVRYYNKGLTDSICTLFPVEAGRNEPCFWKWAESSHDTSSYDDYGKIASYKYLGVDKTDPDNVTVFRVVFANKGVKAISFNLENKKFATFRFDTSSDEIEGMLKKTK